LFNGSAEIIEVTMKKRFSADEGSEPFRFKRRSEVPMLFWGRELSPGLISRKISDWAVARSLVQYGAEAVVWKMKPEQKQKA
jgi:hypothetical protein